VLFDGNHEPDSIKNLIESLATQTKLNIGQESRNGAPSVLLVSSSAVGCLPFISGLKTSNWRVMKLFAKHIKIAQQIEQLKTRKVSVGVGTPNRILQLVRFRSISVRVTNRVHLFSYHKMH